MKLRWLVLATLCATMYGQAIRWDSSVTQPAANVPPGAAANIMTVPNAIVTVCNYPATGNPCTNTVQLYQDQGATQPLAQPLHADAVGRFGFWVLPGVYAYSVQTQSGKVVGNFPLSLDSPAGPQGPGGIGCGTGNCIVAAPAATQTITNPDGTYTTANALSVVGNFLTSNAGAQTIYAWGNSQTQGYGLSGCTTLTCHPDTAWPAVFAAKMGWTLNNQAYGSSDCADLTFQGTSLSLWDLNIDNTSRNIYGHFRNDQSQYGPLPYRVDFARGCIAAQIAWLAIPENAKKRAAGESCTKTGTWTDGLRNSATSETAQAGATITCIVKGKTVYVAAYRIHNAASTRFTVTVDGQNIYDPTTQSTTFAQDLDVGSPSGFPHSEEFIQNLIRVPGLVNQTHTVTYTCIDPSTSVCMVAYMAAVTPDNATANGPFVYTLSPVYNSSPQQTGFMTAGTTSVYYDEWHKIIAELAGDGLQVVGIDATNPIIYDPDTQSQPDGIHPAIAGAASIGTAAVSKATSASTPLDRTVSKLLNAGTAYGCLGAGNSPSPSGAGSTNSTYRIPEGCLWSGTGPNTGRVYFGFDGTSYLERVPDDTETPKYGLGHIFSLGAADGKHSNLAVGGQVTSEMTSTNDGGRNRAINGSVISDEIEEGSGGNGQPNWPNNSVLTTTANRVINADGGTIYFQSNRVTKMTLTGTQLLLGSASVPTVATPTVGQAACIKAAGPPVVIGYCSTVVSAGGSCTCN